MRIVLLVLLLTGCATQPREPTPAQMAVLAYYAEQCQKQGVSEQALKVCIWALYQRDVNAGVYGTNRLGDVMQGMGQTLMAPAQQQTCSTRPDYAGGWVTTCR